VRLWVLVDPALMAAVFGRVDRHREGAAEPLREVVPGDGDEPVVAVDDVEVVPVPQLDTRREHVRVHVLDPGDELAELARALRLADAVDLDAVHLFLGRRLLVAAREDVRLDTLLGEVLGELAHVAREPSFDQRRVLPGEDQRAHVCQGDTSGARSSRGASERSSGSGSGAESRAPRAALSSAAWARTRSSG